MMPGLHTFGSCALASDTPANTSLVDREAEAPFRLQLNGVDATRALRVDTLQGGGSLGQPRECSFLLVNPETPPSEYTTVRITYFSEVLFTGMLKRVTHAQNNPQTLTEYRCQCVDWSELLSRHVIRRNFQQAAPHNILTSLLDHELAGNGLSIGTIDTVIALPLVDSQGGSALDLVRQMAEVTGQVSVIDDDRRIHFLATSVPAGPLSLTGDTVETWSIEDYRDDYRNVQIARVTGTPPDESNEKPRHVEATDENTDQIAERQVLEGTNGRYEAFDKLTHPTSNLAVDLLNLAQSFCQAKLSVAGTIATTLKCKLRGYGWRPGQSVSATFPSLGVAGAWIVQQVSFNTVLGRSLRYELSLTQTTLRQRAWSSWLRMVERGKIVVQLPGIPAPTQQTVTFTSPGAVNWTVPANVYSVTLTLKGAAGSGSGAYNFWHVQRGECFKAGYNGAKGGNGGYAVASVSVVPGQELNLVVGARGPTGGVFGNTGSASCTAGPGPTDGTSATTTTVHRGGVLLAEAVGGGKAIAPSTPGAPGGGSGGIVTVGGGKVGGAGGQYWGSQTGSLGQHGEITIDYVVTP